MNAKAIRFHEAELNAIHAALQFEITRCERFVATDPEVWGPDLASARSALKTLRKVMYPNLTDADFARIASK